MMGLKMLRPNTATFGAPFGLDLLPELHQRTIHLGKVLISERVTESTVKQIPRI